ncbi:hypothetical protein M9H77_22244 [Catharanthus roseus]|uniref:Uncharacterized protein n=1 Tax=Catharanthus roseus TaxID=4058 RepID=A0ACC0AQC2_CATRO|nr:hypothetical protein M9H77_22244 [Catharanthus roseus]
MCPTLRLQQQQELPEPITYCHKDAGSVKKLRGSEPRMNKRLHAPSIINRKVSLFIPFGSSPYFLLGCLLTGWSLMVSDEPSMLYPDVEEDDKDDEDLDANYEVSSASDNDNGDNDEDDDISTSLDPLSSAAVNQ